MNTNQKQIREMLICSMSHQPTTKTHMLLKILTALFICMLIPVYIVSTLYALTKQRVRMYRLNMKVAKTMKYLELKKHQDFNA